MEIMYALCSFALPQLPLPAGVHAAASLQPAPLADADLAVAAAEAEASRAQGARTAGAGGAYVFGPAGGSAAAYEAYVNAGHPATPAACLEPGFTDTFRTNCLLRHDPRKHQELLASLSGCHWTQLSKVNFTVKHQGPAPVPTEETPYEGTTFERCVHASQTSRAAADDDLGAFYAIRIGPVTTQGGKDWTSFSVTSPLSSSILFGMTGGEIAFAAREAFAGAISANGTLLSYPPIHQHHYHAWPVKEPTYVGNASGHPFANTGNDHAVITHGDDVCLHEAGGIACTIRRMAPGYATILRTPLEISADMNDVRAAESEDLTYYLLLTLRGAPHVGAFAAFTEMRIEIIPDDCTFGYFSAFLVPSDRLVVFWKESTWWRNATLLHAYPHTHPPWMEDFMLYTGASGAQIGIDSLNVTGSITEVSRASANHTRDQVMQRAKAAGASLVCRYRRNPAYVEVLEGTAELNSRYYRLAAGCVPFQMTDGEPLLEVEPVPPPHPTHP